MSFNRYTNKRSLLEVNDPQYGQLFDEKDLKLLTTTTLEPQDPRLFSNNVAEVHVYTFAGDYLGYDPDARYIIQDAQTNSILLDVRQVFSLAKIARGSYKIAVNILTPLLGGADSSPLMIREISPDRTEVQLSIHSSALSQLAGLKSTLQNYRVDQILNNFVINFGDNRLCKVINYRIDDQDGSVYLKLYNEVDETVEAKDKAWLAFEVIDPYIDTVTLTSPVAKLPTNQLKGPNFNVEGDLDGSNSTVFKTWNELLDANLPTTQRVIDSALSSSGTATLNIDYTDFSNYIFYSSAEERLKNFRYKLQLIEQYSQDNTTLLSSTSSNSVFVQNSISSNTKRVDQITTNFDSFERWLYYHSTASIFSHDLSGSVTPWPKTSTGGRWVNHHTTSSLATNWYSTNIYSASLYDQQNYNRLYWSIPEHILMDEGNSEYITFVEMIAQHFDILHSYIKALTQIHERDEHPERGPSNELLYHIAKSFGWNLQNTRQLADLWTYKLGTDQSGSYASTGSMASLSHENQTQLIWRRMVNNLPYLLKTKGSSRGVKAIMSMYGIPQTLISIKEYGGPSTADNKPSLIEDRFHYVLNMTGSRVISLPRRPLPSSSGSWKGPTRVADTVEFRFSTTHSSSLSMSLWAIEDGANRSKVNSELQLVHALALTNTASYSGSNSYGKLKFFVSESAGTPVYSPYLPIFDGDMWTVRISTDNPVTGSQPVKIDIARASDNLYGRLAFTSSFSYNPSNNISASWSGTPSTPHYVMFGGTTGSGASRFVGNVQGYKEYFTTYDLATFYEHVLNPSAYNTAVDTGSYYDLFRYYPMGVDTQRWGHGSFEAVSSSHPNRNISFDTTASFYNFSTDQTSNYTHKVETYYIAVPSLGGNTLRSNKVRIEDSTLLHELSPTSYSQRSKYDLAPLDRNRLAIVFAPNDHVNLDIFNHMGFAELDDYVADPSLEFENNYSELDQFAGEYFKKYKQINNVNNLIRILGLYDYTFFDQIKQLAPARADLITGILIEPHVLHTPKVQLTKRPTITNPQWEKTIQLPLTQSGEYPYYETAVSHSRQFTIGYDYLKTSVSASINLSASYFYKKTTISRSYNPTGEYPTYCGQLSRSLVITAEQRHHFQPDQVTTGLTDVIDVIVIKFSGSRGETGSFINKTPVVPGNYPYKRVIYHYEPAGSFTTRYLKDWHRHISQSYNWYSSRSFESTHYQIPEDDTRNISRFVGSKVSGAGINIDSSETVDGGPVVTIIESNPNNLFVGGDESVGNLKVE